MMQLRAGCIDAFLADLHIQLPRLDEIQRGGRKARILRKIKFGCAAFPLFAEFGFGNKCHNYLLCLASKSRISVSKISSLVGSGGGAGVCACLRTAAFIALIMKNTDSAIKKNVSTA